MSENGSENSPPKYPPSSEREYRIVKPLIRAYSRLNLWLYRISGGRILNRFPGGGPVGLLTMTGRKTRTQRTVPLCYAAEGEHIVLVASQGGLPHDPIWFLNLRAIPEVEFTIGRERRRYTARVAEGDEREHFWRVACEPHPDFAEYQKRTSRRLPVVVLEPR